MGSWLWSTLFSTFFFIKMSKTCPRRTPLESRQNFWNRKCPLQGGSTVIISTFLTKENNIEFQHFNIFSCAKRKWALYYLDYFSRGFYFFFTNQEFKFFTWTKFCETRFSVLNIAILENPNCAYKIARR